jgi:hypothetical protein
MFTNIQAKVGLIFHSAEEKRVFSIDFLITSDFIKKLEFSLTHGIRGKSEAGFHLILIFEDSVFISIEL